MSEKKKTIIGAVLLAFFVCLYVAGYVNGEVDTVLAKAAAICMECIGIG